MPSGSESHARGRREGSGGSTATWCLLAETTWRGSLEIKEINKLDRAFGHRNPLGTVGEHVLKEVDIWRIVFVLIFWPTNCEIITSVDVTNPYPDYILQKVELNIKQRVGRKIRFSLKELNLGGGLLTQIIYLFCSQNTFSKGLVQVRPTCVMIIGPLCLTV